MTENDKRNHFNNKLFRQDQIHLRANIDFTQGQEMNQAPGEAWSGNGALGAGNISCPFLLFNTWDLLSMSQQSTESNILPSWEHYRASALWSVRVYVSHIFIRNRAWFLDIEGNIKDICTLMFIGTLFTIAKRWKQLLIIHWVDGWIDKYGR
jgi:hypothetical protein